MDTGRDDDDDGLRLASRLLDSGADTPVRAVRDGFGHADLLCCECRKAALEEIFVRATNDLLDVGRFPVVGCASPDELLVVLGAQASGVAVVGLAGVRGGVLRRRGVGGGGVARGTGLRPEDVGDHQDCDKYHERQYDEDRWAGGWQGRTPCWWEDSAHLY